jgi:hypothetical protein
MYVGLHVKYRYYCHILMKLVNLIDRFSKNTQISNFMKIRPVGAELFHADGQTAHDEAKMLLFANFLKAPKNEFHLNSIQQTAASRIREVCLSTAHVSICTYLFH